MGWFEKPPGSARSRFHSARPCSSRNSGRRRRMARIAATTHSETEASCTPAALQRVTPGGMSGSRWSTPALNDCTTRSPGSCSKIAGTSLANSGPSTIISTFGAGSATSSTLSGSVPISPRSGESGTSTLTRMWSVRSARDSSQADDRDLAIRLLLVARVARRNRRHASERLFTLAAREAIAADLHFARAHLEPDVIRVLDHVVEPGRVIGCSTLGSDDEPAILSIGKATEGRGSLLARPGPFRGEQDDWESHHRAHAVFPATPAVRRDASLHHRLEELLQPLSAPHLCALPPPGRRLNRHLRPLALCPRHRPRPP